MGDIFYGRHFLWGTIRRALNKNRCNQKNEPKLFLPVGVHTKPKPKTNPNPKRSCRIFRVRVRVAHRLDQNYLAIPGILGFFQS